MINIIRVPGATKDAISWNAVPGAEGYRFNVTTPTGVVVSRSFDPTKLTTNVQKGCPVKIEALGFTILDTGQNPIGAPLPTGVAPPLPPTAYTLPTGAVSVKNTAELLAALNGVNLDIVLEDGVYDNPSAVTIGERRIYARNLLKATVKFGVWARSDKLRLQGIAFNCDNAAKTLMDSIIRGGGKDLTVLDCTFDGNKKVGYGIYALEPTGAVVRRCKGKSFTGVAFRLSSNHEGPGKDIRAISDIDIDGVTASPPGASNGTAEAGLWVGEFVTEGVQRIRVRNVSWSGIEAVNNANATVFTDLDVDMGGQLGSARVAFYGEHYEVAGTIDRFLFTNAISGFVAEWAAPEWNFRPSTVNHTIKNGTVRDCNVGLYYDDGNGPGNKVDSVHFENVKVAVGEFQQVAPAKLTNLTYTNVKHQHSNQHYSGPDYQ